MELTSKQRAYLRGEAQSIDPVVMVGKEGLTESVKNALDEALDHHELVKVKFQQYKDDVKDIAFRCADLTSSVLVATTGFTAVFFRQKDKPEDRLFHLPR
ncbi:MAG: YhbY family RNA-binding protein [Bullifex sp.]